jgi:hypothetical protein
MSALGFSAAKLKTLIDFDIFQAFITLLSNTCSMVVYWLELAAPLSFTTTPSFSS